MQGQQAAKSGIDTAHGQAKAGADQAAGTAASQVCMAMLLFQHRTARCMDEGMKQASMIL